MRRRRRRRRSIISFHLPPDIVAMSINVHTIDPIHHI
jgi:hypothetical protein